MSSQQDNSLSLEKILAVLTDLLASVSPEELGESLTQTLRELTGARSVLLLSHQEDWESGSRVYAAPSASAQLFSAEELRLLCPLRRVVAPPRKVTDLPADDALRAALERAGVVCLHQSMLSVAGDHLGSLVILDPPQTVAVEDVLVQLDRLMPLCTLALRNLLCTQRIIEQSRVLADYSEELEAQVKKRSASAEEYRGRSEMLFDKAPVPLCYIDRHGKILEINESFTAHFGYTAEDVSATETFWQSVYPDPHSRAMILATWLRSMRRAIRTGSDIAAVEHTVTCKNGRVRRVITAGNAFGDHFLASYLDVTEQLKINAALRQSEERFFQVAEHAHEWIWEINVNGLFTYASPAVEAILGYKPDEIVGKKYFYDLFRPEERERLKSTIFEIFLNGATFNDFESRSLHRDGREVWLLTSGAPFFDEAGLMVGYRGSKIDITERKLMDTERERLLMAIEQAGETMVITDVAGVVEYVNPAFERVTGYARGEILGQNINLMQSGLHDDTFYSELWQTISSGEVWRGQFVNRRKDGSLYDEEASIAPVRDATGRIVNYVATKLDVTERKKADAALRQKNSEMERFVYTVSHDLKSPLVTIKGFLGVLEEDLVRGDAEAIASDMAFISDAASHMARLLDELLELSRIGRVVNPPAEIEFRELVDETLTLVAGAISAAQVEVVIGDVDVTLYADRPRLLEVLQNLVENAVKYRGNQPAPRITISAEKRSGEWVFCVRDNGLGVAPKYQTKIFGLFEKLDASSEGTGVGLALVSRIIEFYEGRIWVESEGEGQGSCFCFTLPRAMQPGQVS